MLPVSGYIIFMTQQILSSCLYVPDIVQGVDSPAKKTENVHACINLKFSSLLPIRNPS